MNYAKRAVVGHQVDVPKAMGCWFGETWGYTIILGAVYSGVVGWIAKELLHWAYERDYVDRESFFVFINSLAGSSSACQNSSAY